MKLFNSLQLVIMLCIMPYLIGWLSNQEFRGASAAFYSAIGIYVLQLGFTTTAYYNYFEDVK